MPKKMTLTKRIALCLVLAGFVASLLAPMLVQAPK